MKLEQAAERGPYTSSLRSTSSLGVLKRVRLRSAIDFCAPCNSDLDRPGRSFSILCRNRTPDLIRDKIETGFTLIEVVIAITLMALIVMMLYGSFHLGERAMAKAQARSEQSQSVRTFEEFLGGYIRSAYPYRAAPRDPSIYFFGDDRSVEFISALSTSLGGRGMSKVRISSDLAGNRGATLTLDEEMPVRVSENGGGGGGYRNSLVLAEELRGLRLEYLDSQSEDENWVDEWDGRQRRALPRALRLVYRGERGEDIRWTFPIMMRVLAP